MNMTAADQIFRLSPKKRILNVSRCKLQEMNVPMATDSAVFQQGVDVFLKVGSVTETMIVETVQTKTANIAVIIYLNSLQSQFMYRVAQKSKPLSSIIIESY